MRRPARPARLIPALALLALQALPTATPAPAQTPEPRMTDTARGTFTVQMTPHAEPVGVDGVALGRLALAKRFEGGLAGIGAGEMLTAVTPTRGSAGYVAIERFTGTLAGRSGSFVFQHSGTMDQGAQQLSVTVVPGSGTGELQGLAGRFAIQIEGGLHRYEFTYTLPAP